MASEASSRGKSRLTLKTQGSYEVSVATTYQRRVFRETNARKITTSPSHRISNRSGRFDHRAAPSETQQLLEIDSILQDCSYPHESAPKYQRPSILQSNMWRTNQNEFSPHRRNTSMAPASTLSSSQPNASMGVLRGFASPPGFRLFRVQDRVHRCTAAPICRFGSLSNVKLDISDLHSANISRASRINFSTSTRGVMSLRASGLCTYKRLNAFFHASQGPIRKAPFPKPQ